MKRKHKILITLLAVAVTVSLTTVPAFALTESEVQDQVNAVGKEVVTGNLFVWFLCAIAFLKVSQKIDSFMSSLGINVGHTGGSMLAEAMIAMRGIGTARTFAGRGGSGGSSSGSGGGNTFMKGGLSGVVSRKVTNTAINNANGSKSGGLGGMAFNSSLSKGGGFANSVIGKIATGNISSTGSISGESAADSLMSYMGYTALGPDAESVPSFSDVEIGGGHIFATETNDEHPEGIATGVYELSGLKHGGYLLLETKAPDGFTKDDRYFYFPIQKDGETVIVENEIGVGFTNEPIPTPTPKYPDSPQTGDNSKLWLWILLASGSLTVLITVSIVSRKKRKAL